MNEQTTGSDNISWKKALLVATAIFVLFLGVCVGAFTVVDIKDPERFGEGAGRMSLWVFGLGALLSYGRQAKKRSIIALSAIGLGLCFLFIGMIFLYASE
jgi:hypothetical protein